MNKRIGLTVFAVAILAAGFGLGWLARGPRKPASVSAASTPTEALPTDPKDAVEFWHYPSADSGGSAQGGNRHLATFTTPDDIGKVSAWYSERLGNSIPTGHAGAIGNRGDTDGAYSSGCDDSFKPGAPDRPPRGVKLGVGTRKSPASAVTVCLSQVADEDHTHIVVSFVGR